MNRPLMIKLATPSLVIATLMVGCTPGAHHVATAGSKPTKGQAEADKIAARGRSEAAKFAYEAGRALDAGMAPQAVTWSEQAVGYAPGDAGYRFMLGKAYLLAGRFHSAETAFGDSLALKPDQPKASFNLALAQVATGEGDAARATLAGVQGKISEPDRGLATALSGDRDGGLAVLEAAAHAPDADVKARQNLALGYALAGRWAEARAAAAHDLSPADVDARMTDWARFAQAANPADQVAALLRVSAGADEGMPARLALLRDPAAVVRSAAVEPAPAPVEAAPVAVAATEPAPAPELVAEPAAAEKVSFVVPALTPSAPLLRRDPAPLKTKIRSPLVVREAWAPATGGRWVVQLGAFRQTSIENAWTRVRGQWVRLASYTPGRAVFGQGQQSLNRLSLTGFASHDTASALCRMVKARGGDCFVRQAAGDAPVQWASARPVKPAIKTAAAAKPQPVRIASR